MGSARRGSAGRARWLGRAAPASVRSAAGPTRWMDRSAASARIHLGCPAPDRPSRLGCAAARGGRASDLGCAAAAGRDNARVGCHPAPVPGAASHRARLGRAHTASARAARDSAESTPDPWVGTRPRRRRVRPAAARAGARPPPPPAAAQPPPPDPPTRPIRPTRPGASRGGTRRSATRNPGSSRGATAANGRFVRSRE